MSNLEFTAVLAFLAVVLAFGPAFLRWARKEQEAHRREKERARKEGWPDEGW